MMSQQSDKPIQYQNGWGEFYKLKFVLTPDVLIPRSETELLVDEILKFLSHPKTPSSIPLTILDLGTGSGCIAISLAKNTDSTVKVIASEVSKGALRVAQKNAKFHQVEERIQLFQSNLLTDIPDIPDIIVTNLPYIPSYRIPYLDPSVKDYEPILALDGGPDGFDLYRKLFAQIKAKGWEPKLIIGEIDYTQAEIAQLEALKYFPGYNVEIKTDLNHRQRILIIYRMNY